MPRLINQFVKIEIRLLNDPRFFSLKGADQLVYIKLIMLASVQNNRITKDMTLLKSCLRSELSPTDLKLTLKRLKKNFPKFNSNKHFYFFDEYEVRFSKFQKQGGDKIRLDKIRESGSKDPSPKGYSPKNKPVYSPEQNQFLKDKGVL